MEPKEIAEKLDNAFENFKAHHTEDVTRISNSLDKALKDIARLKIGGSSHPDDREDDIGEVARFFAAATRRDVGPEEVAGKNLTPYRDAFLTWARRGDAVSPQIRNELSVGSDPDGGYWVPPTESMSIKRRLFDTSPMRRIASIMSITSDSVKFPTDTNDGTSGGWVGETDSRAETATAQVGEQEIFVREQYAMPKVTQKLLDMSSFNVADWLTNKITDKLRRTENTAFVTGDGVSQPRGFLDYKSTATTDGDSTRSWGLLRYTPTGASGAFPTLSGIAGASDPDSLIDIQQSLKSEYRERAVWLMNRATAGVVRKMKDGDGRLLWQDSLVQGQPPMLLGSPVVAMEDMPDIAADSFSVAYGDFEQAYQIVDGPGIRVLRDPYTSKPYVKFYTTKWTGGDVVNFDAIRLLKFGTS